MIIYFAGSEAGDVIPECVTKKASILLSAHTIRGGKGKKRFAGIVKACRKGAKNGRVRTRPGK